MNLADIAAADVMNVMSEFGSTSLRDFLIFQNPDMESPDYDLYVDRTKIIISTSGSGGSTPEQPPLSGSTSAKLGIAILGSMVLGNE